MPEMKKYRVIRSFVMADRTKSSPPGQGYPDGHTKSSPPGQGKAARGTVVELTSRQAKYLLLSGKITALPAGTRTLTESAPEPSAAGARGKTHKKQQERR